MSVFKLLQITIIENVNIIDENGTCLHWNCEKMYYYEEMKLFDYLYLTSYEVNPLIWL